MPIIYGGEGWGDTRINNRIHHLIGYFVMALTPELQQAFRQMSDLMLRMSRETAVAGDSLKNTATHIAKHGDNITDTFDSISRGLKNNDINKPLHDQIEQHRRLIKNESQMIDARYAQRKSELENESVQIKEAQVYGEEAKRRRAADRASANSDLREKQRQARAAKVAYDTFAATADQYSIADAERLSELQAAVDKTKQEATDLKTARNDVRNAHRTTIKELNDYNVRQAKVTQDLADINPAAAAADMLGKIKSSIIGSIKAFGVFLVANGSAAFYDVIKTARTEMSRQGSIGQTSQLDTASLGMKRSEFAEMSGEYRRTMMAMGGLQEGVDGTVKSVELLKYAQSELYKQTGDMALATKAGMLAYDAMARNGIKPTTARLKRFADTALEVQTMAGITLEQYASMQNDMLDDESTQTAMRMANSEEERDNIQANIQARIKENLALGMSTTQALAAAKALGKMGAEGPMERFKKSMKLQMAMGAMGVGGGEEAARIYRKPEHLRTAEEKASLTGSMSNYSNALSTQQGSEDMGTAMVAEQIGNKSGFDEQSVSMFNTKAIEPLKAELKTNTDALKGVNKALSGWASSLGFFDSALSMLTNTPWLAITAGIAAGGTMLMLSVTKLGMFTKVLGSVASVLKSTKIGGALANRLVGGGFMGPPAPGGAATAANGAMGGMGSGIAKFLGGIGKGIAGVGGGIGKAIKLIFTGTAEGLAQLSNPKLFVGVAVLTALSIPLWAAGKALTAFAGVEWGDVGKGMATMAGLGVMATLLSGASVPMLIGAAAIGVLGGAMWVAGKVMQEFATAFQQFAEVKWDNLGAGLGVFGAGLGELWSKSPNPLALGALAVSIGALGLATMSLQSATMSSVADGVRPLADNVAALNTDKLGFMTDRLSELSKLDAKNLGAVAEAMGQINTNMSPTVMGAITSVATGVWDKLTGTAKPASMTMGNETVGSSIATESKSEEGLTKEEKNRKEMAITEQLKKMDDTNGHLSTVSTDIKQLVDLANKQLVVSTLSEGEKKDSRKKITGDSSGFSASSYSYI